MSDLERSIAEWRWRMLAAGIKGPVPLEELENHLREDVEEQMRAGTGEQQAFETAVQRMGDAGDIKGEFNKACAASWGFRFWWLWLWIGSFGLVQTVIMNLIGPMVFHRHASVFFSQKWWADWFPSYIVWITLAIFGSVTGFANWRLQRKAAHP
jgi:hypothetical protein